MRIRLFSAMLAVTVVAIGLTGLQPAQASQAAASAATDFSELGASAAVNGVDALKSVLIQVQASPADGGSRPGKTVKIGVGADGQVKIELDQYCLDTWSDDGNRPHRGWAYPDNCANNASQVFYLVPVSKTPTVDANPDHAAAYANQWFYIVSASGNVCLTSPHGGLFPKDPHGGRLPYDYATSAICDPNDAKQHFRIANEYWDGDVALGWKAIMMAALTHATNNCATATTPQDSPCLVQADGSTSWLVPGGAAALDVGKEVNVSLGCGEAFENQQPKVTNLTNNDASLAIGSQSQFSHSLALGAGVSVTFGASATAGIKDVWSATGSASLTVNGTVVDTTNTSLTKTMTLTETVGPGMTLMNIWRGKSLQLSGLWQLDRQTRATTTGALAWTYHATSSFPIKSADYVNTAVTTRSIKSCTAAQPATNVVRPSVVAAGQSCDTVRPDGEPTPGTVGTTLTACPGSWKVADGGVAPLYSYQWYSTVAGSQVYTPIRGETGPTLIVKPSFYSPFQSLFIGAFVTEVGNVDRLESSAILANHEAHVEQATTAPAGWEATNFAGWLPDATVGEDYSQPLVTSSGSDMQLSVDQGDLLGLAVSNDGELTGTPTSTGQLSFTVTDTPEDGGPVTARSFTLRVLPAASELLAQPLLSGTVGSAFSAGLITQSPTGDPIVLSGNIPAGLTFDPVTGALSGTPTQDGVDEFSLSGSASSQHYTMTVVDVPTVLDETPLPAGSVGAPYSAQTVTSVGSDVLIGRLAALQPGENTLALDTNPDAPAGQFRMPALLGLTLDSRTGALSGTPTSAGTVVIAVANLADASTPAVLKTLTIAPAGESSAPTAVPGMLAATGSDARPLGIAGVSVLLLGLAVLGLTVLGLRRGRRGQRRQFEESSIK